MDNLKKYLQENKKGLDESYNTEEWWPDIQAALDKRIPQKKKNSLSIRYWSVAAGFALFVLSGISYYIINRPVKQVLITKRVEMSPNQATWDKVVKTQNRMSRASLNHPNTGVPAGKLVSKAVNNLNFRYKRTQRNSTRAHSSTVDLLIAKALHTLDRQENAASFASLKNQYISLITQEHTTRDKIKAALLEDDPVYYSMINQQKTYLLGQIENQLRKCAIIDLNEQSETQSD